MADDSRLQHIVSTPGFEVIAVFDARIARNGRFALNTGRPPGRPFSTAFDPKRTSTKCQVRALVPSGTWVVLFEASFAHDFNEEVGECLVCVQTLQMLDRRGTQCRVKGWCGCSILPGGLAVPDVGRKLRCTECGTRGAFSRPDWQTW